MCFLVIGTLTENHRNFLKNVINIPGYGLEDS